MVQDPEPKGKDRPGVRTGHLVSGVLFLYRYGHWKLTPGSNCNPYCDTHCDIGVYPEPQRRAGGGVCEPGSNNVSNACTHTTADSYAHAYPGTTADSYTYARLDSCAYACVPTNAYTMANAYTTSNTTAYAATTTHSSAHTTAYTATTTHADACTYVSSC